MRSIFILGIRVSIVTMYAINQLIEIFIGDDRKAMLNTNYLRSIRHADPISPQGNVLALTPYQNTPVPSFKPGYRGGVDFMHGDSFWSVCLPPCRVRKFSTISGDGRPGYDRENPKMNVYELHLEPLDVSFAPLRGVFSMAQEWTFHEPNVFKQSTLAADGDMDLWKERCTVPNLHSGITIKQKVWAGGAQKYIRIFEDGVEKTGLTDVYENDIVRVEAAFYGYEMHAESYGYGIRFGPRGVHIIQRAEQCGGGGSESSRVPSSSASTSLNSGSTAATSDES